VESGRWWDARQWVAASIAEKPSKRGQTGLMQVPIYRAGASATGNVSWLDPQLGQPCLDADTSPLVNQKFTSGRSSSLLCQQ
jgi:hypothetical protein